MSGCRVRLVTILVLAGHGCIICTLLVLVCARVVPRSVLCPWLRYSGLVPVVHDCSSERGSGFLGRPSISFFVGCFLYGCHEDVVEVAWFSKFV